MDEHVCPKCENIMTEGYVNTKIDIWEGKINDHPRTQKQLGPLTAYVCEKCGYIELYADTDR